MKEEISLYFRMAFRDGAAGERVILEEKRGLLSYASDWCYLARFRAGAGPVPAPKPCQDGSILAHWIAVFTVIRKQASLVYVSSAKRMASTRPGPFLGAVFFFDRGLMMLIAEASSCVFKCAA